MKFRLCRSLLFSLVYAGYLLMSAEVFSQAIDATGLVVVDNSAIIGTVGGPINVGILGIGVGEQDGTLTIRDGGKVEASIVAIGSLVSLAPRNSR